MLRAPHPRMKKRAIIALVLAWPLGARGAHVERVAQEPDRLPPQLRRWESAPPSPPPACPEGTSDAALDEALRAITFDVGGEPRPLREVRLEGLSTLGEPALWSYLGGKPDKPDGLRATAIVKRLAGSGLFERVAPALSVQGDGVVLTIRLVEQPRLERVVFVGLTEARPGALMEVLLEPAEGAERGDRKHRCQEAPVPPGWLAAVEGDSVRPGIVRHGVRPAMERVMNRLFERGFRMATLSAELGPDGTLTVQVDEGRVRAVEIRGVSPRIEGEVRRLLDVQPGAVFDGDDLGGALRRVREALPFLGPDGQERSTRVRPRVVEETGEGGRRYRVIERPAVHDGGWFTVEGNRLVIYLRARPGQIELDATELIRHTPVTGFAPGLELSTRVWDPGNRVHLTIDLGANVNSHRAPQGAALGEPAGPVPGQRWRFDWMVGPKVELPALRIAELGVQLYSRVDTTDRWRLGRIDSYLYSMIIDRPDSDYFRRRGLTAFITTQLFEHLTGGVEYRRDRYVTLASPQHKYWTLFRRHEAPRATPAIEDGLIASLLLRLEYASAPAAAHRVGVTFRDPERSIVRHGARFWWSDFHTVNTVEIADPGLGGDQFQFVKLVSDSAVVLLRTAAETGLKVRFRVAGRLGGTLPAQKEEALGGWSALRGYGFKELGRGTLSLLSTIEYRWRELSAFVDVGAVRDEAAFGPTRTGVGLALNLGEDAELAFAWRTDDEARLLPEVRLLFERTF
jgi:hypothetical protein